MQQYVPKNIVVVCLKAAMPPNVITHFHSKLKQCLILYFLACQASFHVFGMELFTNMDLDLLSEFFAVFFRLPDLATGEVSWPRGLAQFS